MHIPVIGSAPLPPVVYVPVVQRPGEKDPRHLLLELEDGRTGLPVYTAMDRLQSARGLEQAWMVVRLDRVKTDIREGRADVVVIDHEATHPAPSSTDTEKPSTNNPVTTGRNDRTDRRRTAVPSDPARMSIPGWSTPR